MATLAKLSFKIGNCPDFVAVAVSKICLDFCATSHAAGKTESYSAYSGGPEKVMTFKMSIGCAWFLLQSLKSVLLKTIPPTGEPASDVALSRTTLFGAFTPLISALELRISTHNAGCDFDRGAYDVNYSTRSEFDVKFELPKGVPKGAKKTAPAKKTVAKKPTSNPTPKKTVREEPPVLAPTVETLQKSPFWQVIEDGDSELSSSDSELASGTSGSESLPPPPPKGAAAKTLIVGDTDPACQICTNEVSRCECTFCEDHGRMNMPNFHCNKCCIVEQEKGAAWCLTCIGNSVTESNPKLMWFEVECGCGTAINVCGPCHVEKTVTECSRCELKKSSIVR